VWRGRERSLPLESMSDEKFRKCGWTKVEGNHRLVFGKPRGRFFPFQCLMGPDWFCSLVTVVLITVPSLFAVLHSAPKVGPSATLAGMTSFVVCLGSFMVTAFSDPGILKRSSRAELERLIKEEKAPKNGVLCDRCHIYRPYDAKHCMDCDACIDGYDHHCPWTGKCIGRRNLSFFHVFLFTLLIHFIYVLVIINLEVGFSRGNRRIRPGEASLLRGHP